MQLTSNDVSAVRPLTESDLEQLNLVRNDTPMHLERLQTQEQGKVCYLGAFIGGRAAGFVLVMYENKQDALPYTGGAPCMDMVDLYVSESFRGRGIGTALIAAAEEVCRQQGCA